MKVNQPTIDKFIKMYENEEVTISTTQFQDTIESERDETRVILINGVTIFDRYYAEIDQTSYYKELTDDEQLKYFYRPKKLSFDLYGSTELWSVILRLNEMDSISDFCTPKIRVPSPRIIEKLIEIMDLEEPRINTNKEEVTAVLKNYK